MSVNDYPISPASYTQVKVREEHGWDKLWQEGKTGWDAGAPSPALMDIVHDGRLKMGRALVPGCGSGYDVDFLAQNGWDCTGLDLSKTAIQLVLQNHASTLLDNAHYESGDFFKFETEQKFQLIYDYTFFCAIFPHQRAEWASKMANLIEKDGNLVTLMFPISDHTHGPPFAVQPEHYHSLLDEWFVLEHLVEHPRSHPGREGKEKLGVWKRK